MPVVPGEVEFGSPVPVCSENRLRWDLNPEKIQQLSDELIVNTKKVYDVVGALDLDSVTFENTLKALADVEVEYTGECPPIGSVKLKNINDSELFRGFQKSIVSETSETNWLLYNVHIFIF